MKRLFKLLACSLFLNMAMLTNVATVSAQGTGFDRLTPAFPQGGRKAADIASALTVAAVIAFDAKASWHASDRRRAFVLQGVRVFSVFTFTTLIKGLVARERPDGSDRLSFYSMHTAFAFQTRGGPRASIMVPLAIGTGSLRIGANKHWLTDVLAGAAMGAVTSGLR